MTYIDDTRNILIAQKVREVLTIALDKNKFQLNFDIMVNKTANGKTTISVFTTWQILSIIPFIVDFWI